MGEMTCQRLHESLTPLGNGVALPVFGKEESVGAVVVNVHEFHLVRYSQVSADAPDVTSRTHTTHDVHACIEGLAKASERLQATADGGVLLEYGHLEALLRQDSSREQTTQACTDNHYAPTSFTHASQKNLQR